MKRQDNTDTSIVKTRTTSDLAIFSEALPGYALELDYFTLEKLKTVCKDELAAERQRLMRSAANIALKIRQIELLPDSLWDPQRLKLAKDTSRSAHIAQLRINLGEVLHRLQALEGVKP